MQIWFLLWVFLSVGSFVFKSLGLIWEWREVLIPSVCRSPTALPSVTHVIPKSQGSVIGKMLSINVDLLLDHLHVPLISISFAQLGIFIYNFCGSPSISVSTDALSILEVLAFPFLKCTVIWGNCHKFLYGKIRGLFSINIYGDNTMSFLRIILPSL